ncbi:MAG TPA: ASCH domain-containing protein [Albidovulum sp.]|uniref:ASCH domain-containing protein n=1 Tax=Albidovulum sp. TaxID=1872424 RepID=UPI002C8E8CCA|nr:ASCH domain-containing protein [Albidovulum sp.]
MTSPLVTTLKARYPGAETFTFGDSRELSDGLISLIRAGKKRATCGALRDFAEGGEAHPAPGRRDLALDRDGNPALVIETTEVTIRRFRDVDAGFSLAEGEDATLEGWKEGHRACFERSGGWPPGMDLVCERFRLVEDLAP